MTGPEHYREAERLMAQFDDEIEIDSGAVATAIAHIHAIMTSAQVHATLALAAATALRTTEGLLGGDWQAWYRAASEQPARDRRQREAEAEEFAEEASR